MRRVEWRRLPRPDRRAGPVNFLGLAARRRASPLPFQLKRMSISSRKTAFKAWFLADGPV
jgi:hypothetical protein